MKTLLAQDTKLVSGGDVAADCGGAVGGAIAIVFTDGAGLLAGMGIATAGAAVDCAQDLSSPNPSDGSPTSYDGVDCSQVDYIGGA